MERDEALQAQYYKQIEALVMRTTQAPPYCNPLEDNCARTSVPSQSLRAIHMGEGGGDRPPASLPLHGMVFACAAHCRRHTCARSISPCGALISRACTREPTATRGHVARYKTASPPDPSRVRTGK